MKLKWILAFVFSSFASLAMATPEAEAVQIVKPKVDDFYVNPDARVEFVFNLMPEEFEGPVMVKIWLDGEYHGTHVTNVSANRVSLGVLTPGEHSISLETRGATSQLLKTGPVEFTVRKPPQGETGHIVQLP